MKDFKKNPYKVGLQGEQIVHNCLPGSFWATADSPYRVNWDIVWKRVKIEVKTSATSVIRQTLQRERVAFGNIQMIDPKVEIVVFVGLIRESVYFWVEKVENVLSSYSGKIEMAITDKNKLKDKIREIINF